MDIKVISLLTSDDEEDIDTGHQTEDLFGDDFDEGEFEFADSGGNAEDNKFDEFVGCL